MPIVKDLKLVLSLNAYPSFVLIFIGNDWTFFLKFNFISSQKLQSPAEDVLVTDFFSDHAQNSTATGNIFVYSSAQVLIQTHCLSKTCFNNLELAYFSCLFLVGILIQLLATCVSGIHQEGFSQDVSEIYSVYT